jgi:hypothetical protein
MNIALSKNQTTKSIIFYGLANVDPALSSFLEILGQAEFEIVHHLVL